MICHVSCNDTPKSVETKLIKCVIKYHNQQHHNNGAKDTAECGHPRPHRARSASPKRASAPAPRAPRANELGPPPGIKRPTRKRSGPDPLRSSPSSDIPGYGHEILVLSEPSRVRIFPALFQKPLKRHGDSRSLSEFPRVRIFPARSRNRSRDTEIPGLSPNSHEYGYSRLVSRNRLRDTEIPGLSPHSHEYGYSRLVFRNRSRDTEIPGLSQNFHEYGYSRLDSQNRSRDSEIPGLSLSSAESWHCWRYHKTATAALAAPRRGPL